MTGHQDRKQDSQDKTAGTGPHGLVSLDKAERTGQREYDCKDMAAGTRQLEQNKLDRQLGQYKQYNCDSTGGTGEPGEPRQVTQNRTTGTGESRQVSLERTA
jgi:hypothetical protein